MKAKLKVQSAKDTGRGHVAVKESAQGLQHGCRCIVFFLASPQVTYWGRCHSEHSAQAKVSSTQDLLEGFSEVHCELHIATATLAAVWTENWQWLQVCHIPVCDEEWSLNVYLKLA